MPRTYGSTSNSVSTLAKTGNVITLSITSAEAIQTPTVRIAGQAITPSGSGTSWSAAYTMTDNNTDNVSVSLNISFSDLAGNPGTAVTSTSNGSAVWFDRTVPTLTSVTIASNNSVSTMAKTGDNIT